MLRYLINVPSHFVISCMYVNKCMLVTHINVYLYLKYIFYILRNT